jgi:ElaB/YqjD/DUF883 family membrane-anchored ribosome-binding protein
MDTESQVIQEQMRQTRASLADKLERLEDRVIGAVDETTTAVTQTVQTVSHTVQDAVTGTRETVQSAAAAARETMHETVDALKSACDLRHQVAEHPWLMFGTSAAAGFLAGRLLWQAESASRRPAPAHLNGRHTQGANVPYEAAEEPAQQTPAQPAAPAEHGLMHELANKFSSEIDKLKSLGIATALGVLRDVVKQYLPEPMAPHVTQVIDSVTTKLGGEPIPGPVIPGLVSGGESGEEFGGRRPSRGAGRW